MTYEDYTTVQVLADGDVILVGEEHIGQGGRYSRQLARRVLDDFEPATVAIEATNPMVFRHAGMGALQNYAQSSNVPLAAIDTDAWRSKDYVDKSMLIDVGNEFTYPIEEDGDLDPRAIHNARRAVYEIAEKGVAVEYVFYTHREDYMAGALQWLAENYETPIVAGMGAFHILSVRDKYGSAPEVPLGENRIQDFTQQQDRWLTENSVVS